MLNTKPVVKPMETTVRPCLPKFRDLETACHSSEPGMIVYGPDTCLSWSHYGPGTLRRGYLYRWDWMQTPNNTGREQREDERNRGWNGSCLSKHACRHTGKHLDEAHCRQALY